MKKINWKLLIICVAIPLAVGGLSALITRSGMAGFSEDVVQPPLAPPMWLFPVVWSVLYVLMGVASYYVVTSAAEKSDKTGALWLYGIQLLLNFLWSVVFFDFRLFTFAFIWLLLLLAFVTATAICFGKIRRLAGYLMLPYIVWTVFAGYLNFMISILN